MVIVSARVEKDLESITSVCGGWSLALQAHPCPAAAGWLGGCCWARIGAPLVAVGVKQEEVDRGLARRAIQNIENRRVVTVDGPSFRGSALAAEKSRRLVAEVIDPAVWVVGLGRREARLGQVGCQ